MNYRKRQFAYARKHWDEEGVDLGIRDLLEALNDAGFATWSSCEGHHSPDGEVNSAYLRFYAGVADTSQERAEISRLIKEYTNVPFRFTRVPGLSIGDPKERQINFAGPIVEEPTLSQDYAWGTLASLHPPSLDQESPKNTEVLLPWMTSPEEARKRVKEIGLDRLIRQARTSGFSRQVGEDYNVEDVPPDILEE